ncbi:MAG: response regulator, partial [Anaerolineales bacterium]|nr:response regulator [Anaerolineales bacterium]
HELRTPLNAIIGYSEILQEEATDLEEPAFAADLKKIELAGQHLLELINNVLDLSKIEAGRTDLYLEDFDLQQLMIEIKVTMQPLVVKKGNQFEFHYPEENITLHSDMTKLRQILFNLIGNAAKFTSNGTVTVSASFEQGDTQDWISFFVSDSGIGMSRDDVAKLFKPFIQADLSTTREYGGTGLGLAISRHFARLMGGDITVDSEIGRGSMFTVRIPAKIEKPESYILTAAEERLVSIDEMPRSQKTRRGIVLVIDDDPAARELISHHLTREGFHVETAENGEQGLQLAHQLQPDVITLDVMMPNIDGWTVLSRLKANQALSKIPVVLLTMVEDKTRGFALGAADYIVKPISRKKLLSLVKRYRPTLQNEEPSHVLIIEDDEPTRELIQRTLKSEGWFTAEAQNGLIALEKMQEQKPDLILLDLMMPHMDGFQFLEAIRLKEAWRKIPVIVVTAKDLTAEDRALLNGYVKRILQKGNQSLRELMFEIQEQVIAYMADS